MYPAMPGVVSLAPVKVSGLNFLLSIKMYKIMKPITNKIGRVNIYFHL
jgi:hypothetical protein